MSTATRLAPPSVGDRAPDLTLTDTTGLPVRLSDLCDAAPRALVLVFVRHFG